MGLRRLFFKRSARNILEQMCSDTNVIQIAVARKLLPNYEAQYGRDRAFTLAAAVANKLFGKSSSSHSAEDLAAAEHLAAETLQVDDEIRYAAVMSCRARLLLEADKKSDEQWVLWDTIQWMAGVCDLPPDSPDPQSIRALAVNLHKKYMQP